MIFCHFKHFNKVFSGEGQNKSSDSFLLPIWKKTQKWRNVFFSSNDWFDLCKRKTWKSAKSDFAWWIFKNIKRIDEYLVSRYLWQCIQNCLYTCFCSISWRQGGSSVFREEKKLAHDEFSDQLPEQENEMLLRENKRLRSFLYKTI